VPTITNTPLVPPTPTPSPTGVASCTNLLMNGGFESDSSWLFGVVAVPAQYTGNQYYGGARSMQFGSPPDGAFAGGSYSSIRQAVTIPADASIVTLRWWHLLGTQEAVMNAPGTSSDRQEVLLLTPSEQVLFVAQRVRRNDADWQQTTIDIDLTAYREQTVTLYFNVFNDGNSLRTWMYVDDVQLETCAPSGTPVATLTPTP